MSIKEKIVGKLFASTMDRMVSSKVEEALKAAATSLGRDEDVGWRKLTLDDQRALPSVTQERMIEISYWLWKTNPLAQWIVEIIKDFVVGEGIKVDSDNEDVKAAIDDFWDDPINRMDLYLDKFVREIGLYGEQCWPVFVAEQTGKVRLGYVDPKNIKKVITDPENCKLQVVVVLKGKRGGKGKSLRIILPREANEVLSEKAKQLRDECAGECFFFSINNVTNEPRGTSDLFALADWLDAYEQFLFDYADKWPMLNSFIWNIELMGKTEAEIKEWLKDQEPPKSGSMRAHNENVKWSAVTPDLKAQEAAEGARLLRNHVLGAKGLPEHWYGGGGDVNRATAVEMGTPTFKMMKARQKTVKYIVETVIDYVIYKAIDANYLKIKEDEANSTVSIPEMVSKDITKFASAIQQLSNSLAVAQSQKWIDKETATRSFVFGLSFLGLELDVEKIKEKMKKEKDGEGYEGYK